MRRTHSRHIAPPAPRPSAPAVNPDLRIPLRHLLDCNYNLHGDLLPNPSTNFFRLTAHALTRVSHPLRPATLSSFCSAGLLAGCRVDLLVLALRVGFIANFVLINRIYGVFEKCALTGIIHHKSYFRFVLEFLSCNSAHSRYNSS